MRNRDREDEDMTLSDYERRVLEEIESDFSWAARRRWWRRLAVMPGVWRSGLNVIVAALICAMAIVFLPPVAAAAVASAAGAGLGWAAHCLVRTIRVSANL
jgi:hypothetical protein